MGNKVSRRSILPIVLVFIIITLVVAIGRSLLARWGVDAGVLLGGNTLLFLVTFISFSLYVKALQNDNIQVFLRLMYGSLLVKLFVCMIAAFIYAYLAGKAINRNGILGCFILYILYTFMEVRILIRRTKKLPHHA
jgi:hypothetical protein